MDLTGTGVESWLGLSEETTYGTRQTTVDEYMHFMSEGFAVDTGNFEVQRSSQDPLPRFASRRTPTQRGPLTQELYLQGMELEWKYLLGDHSSTAVIDSTNGVYRNIFATAQRYVPSVGGAVDSTNTSLTIHLARGHASAAGRCYSYSGAFAKSFTVNGGQDGVQLTTDWGFYDLCVPASPPAGPSSWAFDTKHLSHPTLLTVELARLASMSYTAVPDPLSFTISGNTGFANTYPQGVNGGTDYPLPTSPYYNEGRRITGSFRCHDICDSMTFDSCTLRLMMDRGVETALRITLSGPTISGASQRYKAIFLLEGVRLTGIAPGVDGKGPIQRTVTFSAYIADQCTGMADGDLLQVWTENQSGAFGDYSYTP